MDALAPFLETLCTNFNSDFRPSLNLRISKVICVSARLQYIGSSSIDFADSNIALPADNHGQRGNSRGRHRMGRLHALSAAGCQQI